MAIEEKVPKQEMARALIEEIIEPNAVATLSDGQGVILRALVGQIDENAFIAARMLTLNNEIAEKLAHDMLEIVKQNRAPRVQTFGPADAPTDLRG